MKTLWAAVYEEEEVVDISMRFAFGYSREESAGTRPDERHYFSLP
jgi:hypothetical protein